MQSQVNRLSVACDDFGLTISTTKTKAKVQPDPGKTSQKPHITVKRYNLKELSNSPTSAALSNIQLTLTCGDQQQSVTYGRPQKLLEVTQSTLQQSSPPSSTTVRPRPPMASNQFHMIELTRSAVCFTAANKIRFPPEKFQVRIHTFQMKSQDRLAGHVVCIFHSQCLSMCSIESCAWENEQVREKNQQQTKKNRFKATFKDIGITANREALALDRPS